MKKRSLSVLFIIMVLAVLLAACGTSKRDKQEIIREMLLYHGSYGEKADDKVEKLLTELRKTDSSSAAKWNAIMELWDKVNNDLPLYYDVLPDGLCNTDELCIVALGFQLNPDGTMREELKERLGVVKRSAEKYPQAYIVCTGGGTAAANPKVSEASVMASYLMENGISADRIIIEDQSITTAQNAKFTLDILETNYPVVSHLAIISSDYHIASGLLLFGAEATLEAKAAGKERYDIVSNAAYKAPSGTLTMMFQAGALIELSGDIETAFDIYYDTYDIHELPPLE